MEENKSKITISITPELLRRIDAVADAREMKRSTLIERMLTNEIDLQEGYVSDMEKPLQRAVAHLLVRNPTVMKAIAAVVGEQITDEQVERARRELPAEMARGKKRQEAKKESRIEGRPATA